MPTQALHIIEQVACIWLRVDQDAPLEQLIEEAKQLAASEDTMVMFAIYARGQLFRVTATSKTDAMVTASNDYFNSKMVIS